MLQSLDKLRCCMWLHFAAGGHEGRPCEGGPSGLRTIMDSY